MYMDVVLDDVGPEIVMYPVRARAFETLVVLSVAESSDFVMRN